MCCVWNENKVNSHTLANFKVWVRKTQARDAKKQNSNLKVTVFWSEKFNRESDEGTSFNGA